MKNKAKPFKMWMIFGWKSGRAVCVMPGYAFMKRGIAHNYLVINRLDETWHPRRVEIKPL